MAQLQALTPDFSSHLVSNLMVQLDSPSDFLLVSNGNHMYLVTL